MRHIKSRQTIHSAVPASFSFPLGCRKDLSFVTTMKEVRTSMASRWTVVLVRHKYLRLSRRINGGE
jgi:hypothetical protein